MKRYTLPLLIAVSIGSSASAQDQCRDILTAQLFNTATGTKKEETANAEFYWACGASLSEARDYVERKTSQSGGGGGSLNYGVLSIEGGGQSSSSDSLTEEHLKTWKQQNCSEMSSEQSRSAFEYYANASVAGGVVQAWRDCMIAREDLTCWARPYGKNILFTRNWRSSEVALPIVVDAHVAIGDATQDMWAKGEKVKIGEVSYSIKRNPEEDALFLVDIEHEERFALSCEAYVPAMKQIVISPAAQEPAVNATIQKLVNSYPNQTVDLVVGASAGGPTDSQARSLASRLEDQKGWKVQIVNVGGNKGQAAVDNVANANPDGYRVLFSSTSNGTAAGAVLTEVGNTGLFVPKDTPPGIIEKLAQAVSES